MQKIISNNKEVDKQILTYKVCNSNDLIQSHSDFTVMEHRIILLALIQITQKDIVLKNYRVFMSDILGKNSHSHHAQQVKKSIKKLKNTTIIIQNSKKWEEYPFITQSQEGNHNGKSFVEIQFHTDIQKFLLRLKSYYTPYTLRNLINFKNNYSLRIYELCKQYQKMGYLEITIQFLRYILSIENRYTKFNNLKESILKPSLQEINMYTDLFVSFEKIFENRLIVRFKFLISKKNEPQLPIKTEQIVIKEEVQKSGTRVPFSGKVQNILIDSGFKAHHIAKFEEQYSETHMQEVLNLLQTQQYIRNPKAWIRTALNDSYSVIQNKRSKTLSKLDIFENRILSFKIEINNLYDAVERDQEDSDYYQGMQTLDNSDITRFDGMTVEDVIEKLEIQILENQFQILKIELCIKKSEKNFITFEP